MDQEELKEPSWDDMYVTLAKEATNLRDAEEFDANGVDGFLDNKIKIASLGDLSDFFRIATDTLVHKAEKDLWKISEDAKGTVVIERLFDPDTKKPIKV
jgi:hypothetical protein